MIKVIDELRGEGNIYKVTKEKIIIIDKNILNILGKVVIVCLTDTSVVIVIPHHKCYCKQLYKELGEEI